MSWRGVCVALGLFAAVPAEAGDLRISVRGVETEGGQVRVALFTSAARFEARAPYAGAFVSAQKPGIAVVFADLPPGRYGISTFHDRDGDEKLGTRLGIPNEPYGFSRNPRGVLGPPSFDDVVFDLGPEGAEIEIHLR